MKETFDVYIQNPIIFKFTSCHISFISQNTHKFQTGSKRNPTKDEFLQFLANVPDIKSTFNTEIKKTPHEEKEKPTGA